MMDPAKAMAVPRDIRVEVVPREVPTRRVTRAVEEDPARREDPIPRDTRAVVTTEATDLVRREAPNLDLDHMMDTLEVAMEEMTAVDRNAERTVLSKATLQAFATREHVKST
jgi:hypothetical protein